MLIGKQWYQLPEFIPFNSNLVTQQYKIQAETSLRSVSAWMPRAYRAARSIPWIYIALRAPSGLCIRVVEWNIWKSVAPQLQTCCIDDVIITVTSSTRRHDMSFL